MKKTLAVLLLTLLPCGAALAQQPFGQWNDKEAEELNRKLIDEKVRAAENIKKDVQREADWSVALFWMFLLVGAAAAGVFVLSTHRWARQARDTMEKTEQSAKNAKLILDELEKRHRELARLIKESSQQIQNALREGEEKFRQIAREQVENIQTDGKREQAAFELFIRAARLHDEDRYDEAIRAWDEVIEKNGDNARPFCNRGIAKYMKGRYSRAVRDFSKAITLSEESGDTLYTAIAYNHRGLAKREGGDHDGAIADYEEAIRLDPGNAEAFCNRGLSKMEKGDHDSAVADYSRATELNPDSESAFFKWACVLALKGDKEHMLEKLSRAVFLDSKVKKQAREHNDFKKYWKDADFKKLTKV